MMFQIIAIMATIILQTGTKDSLRIIMSLFQRGGENARETLRVLCYDKTSWVLDSFTYFA
jgi:hypothetical protein